MHICRLIRDGFNDGFYNMAVDEAVADAVEKGASPSTLRLYGWKSPTLSIGYSQRTDKKIDTGYCRKNKIDIVLRPTGGRAVLHDKEVTYSLASPKNNPLFPDNISGTYRVIGEALSKGLSFLGIDANSNSAFRIPHSEFRNPSCFATTSQYEITVDGKKLIGSAQRRFENSFLQHGSIPLENHHDKLALCLGFKEGHKSKKFVKLLKEKSIALNELNGRVFSYDEVIDAFIKGFEDVFKPVPEDSNQGIQFKISPLTEYELKLAKKLYERKITSP
ncbi:MAG: lipoate--protein ligase family protein [Nitrospinae bacterium]|nr:lipoate--protein ligase family protein [Nitrospinota bacterium]